MAYCMEFPDDWHDFLKSNQFIDSKEVYTNGSELIQVYRVEQLIEHLLKEQEDEKKRVMKVIWDTLHEGLSIDTIPDQDWVYERIRHRIEDT